MRKIVLMVTVLVFFWGFLGESMASDVSLDILLSDPGFCSAYETVKEVDSPKERNRLYRQLADAVFKKYGKESKNIFVELYTKDLKAMKAIENPYTIAYRYWVLGVALKEDFGSEGDAMEFFGSAFGVSYDIPDVEKRSEIQMLIILTWAEMNSEAAVERAMEIEDPETRAYTLIRVWGK